MIFIRKKIQPAATAQHRNSLLRRGDALVLTMFIMAGMLIVAMSGAYVVLLGIKASGVQSQSTKAYFAAEAGAEQLLYMFRQTGYSGYGGNSREFLFSSTFAPGTSYSVYYIPSISPLIFDSVGSYLNSKRSVEIRMGQ